MDSRPDQIRALCGQLESVFLRRLLESPGAGKQRELSFEPADADDDSKSSGSSAMQSLFAAALAEAIERAGGIGMGAALARMLGAGRPPAR